MNMNLQHRKMLNTTTHDRISALPDGVLLHILSLLDDTRETQKTSVLSKRWQFLWTSVPTLTFQDYRSQPDETRKFVAWAHKTLLCCRNSSLQKFFVMFDYSDCFASDVDVWARFVLEKEVKELSLSFPLSEYYSLPHSVYCNSFLMKLSIRVCKLVPKRGINWTRLKSLSMVLVELNEDTIEKILLGSPMLEYLNFDNCDGFKRLDIYSESLRILLINYTFVSMDIDDLRISAPNLQSLHIVGNNNIIQFRLMSVSSMLKIELQYYSVHNKDCFDEIEFLESLHNVVELELGHMCIQALAPLLVEGKTLSSPLTALRCLKVNAFIDRQVAAGIISLLKCSPNLEKLVIKRPSECYGTKSCPKQVKDYWKSGKKIEKISLPCLKTIKCHGFEKLADAGEFTRILLPLLLESTGFLFHDASSIVLDLINTAKGSLEA